jgi:hypothetical protein
MKLRISSEVIKTVLNPYQFTVIDVMSIVPRVTVGQFEGCALNLACSKTLIITNGIVLSYSKLEDFLSGFEPLSLVEDETIYYDQELSTIDFKIIPEHKEGVDAGAFATVQNLMFGARVDEDEDEAIQNDEQSIIIP